MDKPGPKDGSRGWRRFLYEGGGGWLLAGLAGLIGLLAVMPSEFWAALPGAARLGWTDEDPVRELRPWPPRASLSRPEFRPRQPVKAVSDPGPAGQSRAPGLDTENLRPDEYWEQTGPGELRDRDELRDALGPMQAGGRELLQAMRFNGTQRLVGGYGAAGGHASVPAGPGRAGPAVPNGAGRWGASPVGERRGKASDRSVTAVAANPGLQPGDPAAFNRRLLRPGATFGGIAGGGYPAGGGIAGGGRRIPAGGGNGYGRTGFGAGGSGTPGSPAGSGGGGGFWGGGGGPPGSGDDPGTGPKKPSAKVGAPVIIKVAPSDGKPQVEMPDACAIAAGACLDIQGRYDVKLKTAEDTQKTCKKKVLSCRTWTYGIRRCQTVEVIDMPCWNAQALVIQQTRADRDINMGTCHGEMAAACK